MPTGPYDTSPLGKSGGQRRLPDFVRAVAHALIRAGHPKDKAIQIAIGTLENWASGKGNVHPDTRARAAKAIAEWRALSAARKTTHLTSETPMPFDLLDLARAAIHLHGRAKPESKQAVKVHITRRAKALGATHLLPKAWGK